MAIDPNKIASDISFSDVVLWVLSLATLVQVLDANGFLPKFLARWFAKNRFEATLKALKDMGVKVEWEDPLDRGAVAKFKSAISCESPSYVGALKSLMDSTIYHGKAQIGAGRHFQSDSFVDIMGESTNFGTATHCAKLLNTHLGHLSTPLSFGAIATPKSGSPLIGYEFSRLQRKPLILGYQRKCESEVMGCHATMDFPRGLELKGLKVLLVDDSTTGGSKMAELVTALRSEGAVVEAALVLFEPRGKGAKDRLAKLDVALHSIVAGPEGR
jgi:orotate phosphoribosyltransferase